MSKLVVPHAIKEIRFHLSQTLESSNGLRSFLTKSYPALNKQNPTLPILIREASFVSPLVFVRYEKGREVKKDLNGLDEKQIETEVKNLLGL